MPAITGSLCFKNVIQEEQGLPDKTETDLKMDFKMTGYRNDTGKDVALDIPIKVMVLLIIKRDIQITNQKNDLGLHTRFTKETYSFRRIF